MAIEVPFEVEPLVVAVEIPLVVAAVPTLAVAAPFGIEPLLDVDVHRLDQLLDVGVFLVDPRVQPCAVLVAGLRADHLVEPPVVEGHLVVGVLLANRSVWLHATVVGALHAPCLV